MRTWILPVALLAAGALPAAQAPSPAPSAPELARRVQSHYQTVRDFAADFTMTYRGALLRQSTVERGDVRIKKPNRMWWRYTSPDKKVYVADGAQYYQYFPEDKFGMRSPLPKASDSSAALLFLAGKGDLVRDFTAAVPAAQPDGEYRLVLTPIKKQEDFATLTLVVDRKTFDLRGLVQQLEDGSTSSFMFSRFRPNVGLKDSDFVFSFPPGTAVK